MHVALGCLGQTEQRDEEALRSGLGRELGSKAVEEYTRTMRREILGIPLAARLMVGRWSELRSANQVTAKLSGLVALDSENLLATFRAGTNGMEAEKRVREDGAVRNLERDASMAEMDLKGRIMSIMLLRDLTMQR